jgi:hypothetical protein
MAVPASRRAPSGARRAVSGLRPHWPWAAAALGLLALAGWEHIEFSAGLSRALGDALRGAAAGGALFFACGYAPARLLAPADLRPYTMLLAFPVGAAACAIALAALGLLHVPFGVSLPLVVAAGGAGGVAVRLRRGPLRAELTPGQPAAGPAERVAWPALVAAVVAIVALSPVWRTGFATVVGQNGDVVLAVGSADLVKEAPPTALRPELPVDRIPLVWRSKYPIFYALAAVSEVSGLSTIAAFPLLAAAMLAMAAFGFFLLARCALRAPPAAALAAMAAVGLSRLPVHLADHPFYNQLWALFALPFILVAGMSFLRAPGGRSLGLLVLFGAVGAFAYPLMLPFPALFLAVGAWRERGRLDLEGAVRRLRAGRPAWLWAPAALVAAAILAVLVRGVAEKGASAAVALSPWGNLSGWSGSGLPHLPFHRAFALLDPGGVGLVALALAVVLGAAAWGLYRVPRDAGVPLAVTLAGGLAFGVYFMHRAQAELFYFKTMGFAGPLVVMLAVLGLLDLARRRPRVLAAGAAVALAAFVAMGAVNTRRELLATNDYASRYVLEMRDWSAALPRDATVRIDIPPSGHQLWADYMLAARRVCALHPLVGFFPYAPPGRKADYAVTYSEQPRPADAAGARPIRANRQFHLWRLRPGLPGPDHCSRRMIDSITRVEIA